jgi:hypothetical protein
MLSLIETLTGFAAIMLMLSLLVKTLTSVIKNQADYYSDNLRHEVQRLALETTGKAWDTLMQNPNTPDWARNIHWERLGDEVLTPAYMSWFLRQLDQNARVFDLDTRLKIHVANVNYAFQIRMKNLALAVGLALCLLGNINSLTIWKSLYKDQQLRAKFSGPYAERAAALANGEAPKGASTTPTPQTLPPGQTPQTLEPPKKLSPDEAAAQIKTFQSNMRSFLTDVSFGVGKIWRAHPPDYTTETDDEKKSGFEFFSYEFFGSLLTGILVSIGAPYLHDLLQALAALRPDKTSG